MPAQLPGLAWQCYVPWTLHQDWYAIRHGYAGWCAAMSAALKKLNRDRRKKIVIPEKPWMRLSFAINLAKTWMLKEEDMHAEKLVRPEV